jgi:MFS family permease
MFFAGTLIAGIGSGAGFSAVMQILAPLADEHERAELFTAIFIACYLSLSVPPIVAGFQVGIFGLLDTARVYFTLMLVVALVSGWLYRQIQLKRSVVESLGRN